MEGEEMDSTINPQHDPEHDSAKTGGGVNEGRPDSWIDAIVTLLATIVFGLGWTLVELERAEPPLNRYDTAASQTWIESVRNVGWGDEDKRWTELALQSSNR
jgi:hypothetical protein